MTLVLVVFAFAILLVALFLRKKPQRDREDIPVPVTSAVMVMIGAIVAGSIATVLLSPSPRARAVSTQRMPYPPTGQALSRGVRVPEIKAAGWVNGAPTANPGIRVIDVWAPWCNVCDDMAPGLVRAHQRYSPQGVEFVSLTDMSKVAVDGFVGHYNIPWPSGYGAPRETVSGFRALREGVTDSQRMISPTLYIVNAQGTVLWTDDAGRYRHENVEDLLAELNSQLDKALASVKPS